MTLTKAKEQFEYAMRNCVQTAEQNTFHGHACHYWRGAASVYAQILKEDYGIRAHYSDGRAEYVEVSR